MKYTHIFWDWNGTLLDDVGAALESVNGMLIRRGRETISLAQYQEYMDTPIIKFYENVLDLNEEDYLSVLKEYNDGYESRLYEIELARGARETLDRLRNSGVRQLIISSCEQNQLDFVIRHFGLEQFFDAVLGSEDFYAGSKVERAKAYIKVNGIDPGKVLVVGDLLHDFEMAKSIGSDCLLFIGGHQSEEKLITSGFPVVRSMEEIMSTIKF